MPRRITYVLLALITIALGLSIRHFASSLGFVGQYVPDTLWAMLIYWIFAFCSPRASGIKIALIALLFCYAIEISQLYQAPWIDSLRANRLGGLVLGYGFLWSDIACYTIGVALAAAIQVWIVRR